MRDKTNRQVHKHKLKTMEITSMSQAMQLHAQALKQASQPHHQNLSKIFTFTALSPSGDLNYARNILSSLKTPNSFYYNTMIRAFSDSLNPSQSIALFLEMNFQDGSSRLVPRPDNYTYTFVLKACGKLGDTRMGKRVHGSVLKLGFDGDKYVRNSLVRMYERCGELGCARKVFDEMSERDVVSWTALVDGLVDNGRSVEAVECFGEMVECGVEVNDATVVAVLRACADAGALEVGKKVHGIVRDLGIVENVDVNTGLIDMFSKCGCVDYAREVFDNLASKEVCSWTAMIHGLASHGMSKEAIGLFDEMINSGVKPDERTMTAVLIACRNVGWTSEACVYLNDMSQRYGVTPHLQHYGCIVDLYARSGQLEEAEDFIRTRHISPAAALWRTLISGCKIHGDSNRAERLIKKLNNSDDCSNFVQGVINPLETSKIEVHGHVHEFAAGGSNHTEAHNIFEKLDEINQKLREEGCYKPVVSDLLLDMDEKENAFQSVHHSEKLAVAFGLIKTEPGSQIRIVKNLRTCADCHSFMKLVSRTYKREIVVRDRIRFHHFRNGECSCGDHW